MMAHLNPCPCLREYTIVRHRATFVTVIREAASVHEGLHGLCTGMLHAHECLQITRRSVSVLHPSTAYT